MYLKAVEIYGFKSFGERVYIDFNKGITSIVGPNGSGKSNILDAVLWVLGEQSYKNIRAKESQDVIFSGGKDKKNMTKAEVSLYIDNNDRYLDIDDDLVKITRKIEINGENEYLINETKSRLKDINSLFLDTGIGKSAYSVIGQGKVERIINSSPKEIKNIIEEAAGIKKFQLNKADALRNLSNVENELEKVELLLKETRENKNKIEAQAENAQKFLDLKNEKNSLTKGIYLIELTQKESDFVKLQEDKSVYEESCKKLEENLSKCIQRLDFIDSEREEVKKEITAINSKNSSLRDKITEKEKELAITTERISNFRKENSGYEKRILDVKNKINLSEKEKNTALLEKENLLNSIRSIEKENIEFEKKIEDLSLQKKEKEIILEEKNKKIRDSEIEKLTIINDIEVINKRKKSNEDDIENYNKELIKTEEDLQVLLAEKEKKNNLLNEKNIEFKNIEKRNLFLENELSEIGKKINKLSEKIRTADYDYHMLSSKFDALKRMQENNEGFYKSVKEILNSSIKGIEGVLISLINFDPKFQKAVENSVPANLQDIIVKNKEVAKEAITFLTKNKFGRASFLSLDLIKAQKREFNHNIPGVLGIAANFIETKSEYQKVVDFVFGNILIVENIDVGTDIINKNLFSGNVVSLAGDLISSRGRITGGETSKSNISQIFERKKEIEELSEKIKSLKKEIDEDTASRENLSIKLEKYENEILEIDNLEDNCHKEISKLSTECDEIDYKIKKIETEISILKSNIEEEEKYKKEFLNKIDSSITAKEEIEFRIQNLNKEIEIEEKNKKIIIENIDEINKKFSDKRILYLNNKDKVDGIDNNLIKMEKEILDLKAEEKLTEENIQNLNKEIEMLENKEIEISKEIEENTKIFNSKNKDMEVLTEREFNLSNEERDLNKEKNKIESESLHQNDKLKKINDNILSLIEIIQEIKSNLDQLNEITAEKIEVEKLKSAKEKLKILEGKINNFGDVNLLAINEFKELKQKYDFMASQRDDIVKSRKSLFNLIEEIDETIHENFYKTYDEINLNFNKICNETIKNTEGKLNLINPENFDSCGVEIFVKFKNKKKQPLSLLSGGEKSMVAIAFILAIFMYKPSPFTFLDEIEAALDEKNTKNLLAKLREFTEKSQFILITHNKDTMKESDSIFGVTMNKEIGISKIVPVKF